VRQERLILETGVPLSPAEVTEVYAKRWAIQTILIQVMNNRGLEGDVAAVLSGFSSLAALGKREVLKKSDAGSR